MERVESLMASMAHWPVTPEVARQAAQEYQAVHGLDDADLAESPGWWLWKRTRELAQ